MSFFDVPDRPLDPPDFEFIEPDEDALYEEFRQREVDDLELEKQRQEEFWHRSDQDNQCANEPIY